MVSSLCPEIQTNENSLLDKLFDLNEIGIALSAERDKDRLLEKILISAKKLTSADGCTLYSLTERKTLRFEFIACDSLGLAPQRGKQMEEIPLYLDKNVPNEKAVSAYTALKDQGVNISDVYDEKRFDFTGPKLFDAKYGYRTKSLLTCPLRGNEGEVIGVLQLINCYDPKSGLILPFSKESEHLALSLASQAAIAMTNRRLIEDLKKLFDSVTRLIAEAVDEKSPSMGNHDRRVPMVVDMLADAINETDEGPLAELHFSDDELWQLRIAAWLHDCGKLSLPEHILEKHEKMETLFDRFELIKSRYCYLRALKREEIYKEKLLWLKRHNAVLFEAARSFFSSLDRQLHETLTQLMEEQEFLERLAKGKENVTDEVKERVKKIAARPIDLEGHSSSFLTDEEVELLTIKGGTLTDKERKVIEHHAEDSYRLLSKLIFPKELNRVPEIVVSHHERNDGSGYPKGLSNGEIPIESRILAIADVFEALSAPDRPYKPPLPLSIVFKIMDQEAAKGHLDKDLYEVFKKKKVALQYAEDFLKPEQMDV